MRTFIRKYGLVAGLMALVLYESPYLLLGENAYVTVLDVLDGLLPGLVVLVKSGEVFSLDGVLSPIMTELPRISYASGLNVLTWLLLLFGPYPAYVINEIAVHLLAFMGMYLLLRNHLSVGDDQAWLVPAVSLCFALLPFYTVYGLSIAGQPLLLNAFLNLRKEAHRIGDYAVALCFPFYSVLALTGIFILVGLGCLWLYDRIRWGKVSKAFTLGVFFLAIGYGVAEYQLAYGMISGSGFQSHRLERGQMTTPNDLTEAVLFSLDNLAFGQFHAVSYHTPILMLTLLVIPLLIIRKDLRILRNTRLLFGLLGLAAGISFFCGVYSWSGIAPLKEKASLLRMFKFDRVHWFHPLLWYCLLAVMLLALARFKHGTKIAFVILGVQCAYITGQWGAHRTNFKKLAYAAIDRTQDEVSFRSFFASRMFDSIAGFIAKPRESYRVASIGMYPSVAQYNGFHTLDGYMSMYPLEHKHKFRRVIEGELAKSDALRRYFDEWGNRAYVFASELEGTSHPMMVGKHEGIVIRNLSLNSGALRDMGCSYVFSAVRIENAPENGLILEREFEDQESYWKIFLYRVDGTPMRYSGL